METSFTELRDKEVINVLNGKLLGNVCDIIVDFRLNCILGIVVPGDKSFFKIFKPCQEIFIPVCNICKIGEDVILVEIVENNLKKKKKTVKIFDASESIDQKDNSLENKEN